MSYAVRFAFYCSGHGYGHATRVSAFASSLLSLDVKLSIYVVSSAPPSVFSECVNRGALYRNAEIDPVIVQPLAYRVDRQKSVQVLQQFLFQKEEKLSTEVEWLLSEHIDCVLSDAVSLACEAATKACIPSILITNFTFDSVYSYLGTEIIDNPSISQSDTLKIPNTTADIQNHMDELPIPEHVLAPLVSQLYTGYRHADILLLLPGFIPIPSFFQSISLPAPTWTDPSTNRFKPHIESLLRALPTSHPALLPSIPFPVKYQHSGINNTLKTKPPRVVKYAPLLVRPASGDIHKPEGRSRLLSSIGIPEDLHDPVQTQILVVSFGGQNIGRPHGGISPSRVPSPLDAKYTTNQPDRSSPNIHSQNTPGNSIQTTTSNGHYLSYTHPHLMAKNMNVPNTLASAKHLISPDFPNLPRFEYNGETELQDDGVLDSGPPSHCEPCLLPSPSWIAIICGVPSKWSVTGEEVLPAGFYIAPSGVYMPDLTAVADVIMGKLGYGTVSETIAQCTPLVYVPRPLFVEEHGLRLLLEAEGIGVELSSDMYETGEWAGKVEEAYLKGRRWRRNDQEANELKVKELASWVVESVQGWT